MQFVEYNDEGSVINVLDNDTTFERVMPAYLPCTVAGIQAGYRFEDYKAGQINLYDVKPPREEARETLSSLLRQYHDRCMGGA